MFLLKQMGEFVSFTSDTVENHFWIQHDLKSTLTSTHVSPAREPFKCVLVCYCSNRFILWLLNLPRVLHSEVKVGLCVWYVKPWLALRDIVDVQPMGKFQQCADLIYALHLCKPHAHTDIYLVLRRVVTLNSLGFRLPDRCALQCWSYLMQCSTQRVAVFLAYAVSLQSAQNLQFLVGA